MNNEGSSGLECYRCGEVGSESCDVMERSWNRRSYQVKCHDPGRTINSLIPGLQLTSDVCSKYYDDTGKSTPIEYFIIELKLTFFFEFKKKINFLNF